MRPQRRRGTGGQAMIIVALAGVLLFGIGAFVLDAGIGQADRRHLQEVADNAALAGAQTSGTTAAQNYVAMLYLERNLGWSSLPSGCTSSTTCPGATYTSGDYTVTLANSSGTIDISLNHQRSPVVAGVLGFTSTNSAGAHESAGTGSRAVTAQPGGTFGYALYSQTTVSTGNQVEEVDGDVYVGTNLSPQSHGQAGFCTKATGGASGYIVFGSPLAFTGSVVDGVSCTGAAGGGIIDQAAAGGSCSGAAGSVSWDTIHAVCVANPAISPPTYTAPTATGAVPSCTVSSVIASGFYAVTLAACPSFTIDFGKDGFNLSCVSFLIDPGVQVSINGKGGGSITAYGAASQTPACAGAGNASNRFVIYQKHYTPCTGTGCTPARTTFSVQGPGCCPTYAFTGEIYTPDAAWSMSTNAQLTDDGQVIVYSYDDQSGNHPNPVVVYDPAQTANTLNSGGLQR